jgi:hypothetical protein
MGDLSVICEQRKQFQLYNIPPIRFEPISPYPAFTQEQLNMRRKTEILKYNKNSTQGPRMTKKQRLAATFRGGYNAARVVCPNDFRIPVLSTSAGVPGPPIYLVEDPDVPLYNYAKDTNAYAENLYADDVEWIFTPTANQLCPDNSIFTEIAKLVIRKPIQQAYTQFNYQTPILFRLRGTAPTAKSAGATINANIGTFLMSFRVTYNQNNLDNHAQLTSRFLQNSSISAQLVPPSGSSTTFNYFCEAYVGILEISGIRLTTSPGFVYGLNIRYNSLNKVANSIIGTDQEKIDNNNTIISGMTFELYANLADSYILQPSLNCTLLPSSTLVFPPAKNVVFTGIPI